ncbi:MAG: hypothetical protein ACYC7E_03925 [Armatimonadota bacterium]
MLIVSIYAPVLADGGAGDRARQLDARLVFDKPVYYLGENMLAHYALTNTGEQDISIDWGGDYRGAPRALRFKVTAVDAHGSEIADPYLDIMCMGGLGGGYTIKPGKTFWASLQVMHYCDFTLPGTYTIQVYHDLGWDKRDSATDTVDPQNRTAPTVTGTVTLKLPTAEQAASIVNEMTTLVDLSGTLGERRPAFPDFTTLRFPVYLPALLALVEQGNLKALDGIAAIRTPEATRALMTLSKSENRQTADKALQALLLRLPKDTGRLYGGTRLRGLPDWSWSGHLAPDVLDIAWRLLARDDRQCLIYGAQILECLGRPGDLPRLQTALDRVITLLKDDPVEQNAYLRPITACDTLVRAGEAILARGGQATLSATPAGEILMLSAIKRNPAYRPDKWRSTALALLKHPIPFVRETAVAKLPVPLDPVFYDQFTQLITDPAPPVQGAAFHVVSQAPDNRFGEAAHTALETAKNEWIIDSAFDSAVRCGISRDRVLETCLKRLDEPGITVRLFDQIIDAVILWENGKGGRSSLSIEEARRLQARWQSFLAENREALRAGKRFPLATPPLTEDLLPAGYHFYRKDGTRWPAEKKDK